MVNRNGTDDINDRIDLIEDETDSKKNFKAATTSFAINLRNNVRSVFSKLCEQSVLSRLTDNLYYVILNCPVKAFAVFFTTLGVLSLLFSYLIEYDGIAFFIDVNNISSFIILISGLILFTTKKTLNDLISGSVLLSKLDISYSQSAVFSANSEKQFDYSNHSTALFIGIIFGIISINFPAVYIILFLASLMYAVFIFSRPECGVMLIIAILPILNSTAVLMLSIISFISLIFKYLRGKRHINANLLLLVSLIAFIYFLIRGFANKTGSFDYIEILSYISFLLVCITATSLIRSTSMLNKAINLLVTVTRLYIVIFICYYVCCVIFGLDVANSYLYALSFAGLDAAITDVSFFASFIMIAVPLNFALMISSKNAAGFIKNIVFFSLSVICTGFVEKYWFILIALISCTVILIFIKKRFAIFTVLTPILAYGLNFLFKIIPDNYVVYFLKHSDVTGDAVKQLIKHNLAFGIGIGKNNRIDVLEDLTSQSFNEAFFADNTIFALLLSVGVVGAVIILSIIAIMLIKNVEFILNSDNLKSYKVRILSAGLFASSLSFILNCLFMDCLTDYRILCLFALVLSLGFVCKQSFEADFIDESTVREYNN